MVEILTKQPTEPQRGEEVLFMCLDVSGSMEMPFVPKTAGPKRIEALKVAASLLVNASDEAGCQIGVVAYSETPTLVSAPTRDYEKLKQRITDMGTATMTFMGKGLNMCRLDLIERRFAKKRIILLSDGQESIYDERYSARHIVPHFLVPRSITVDCVGIGEEVDLNLLQWIADKTGGICIGPKTPSDLNQGFLSLESRRRILPGSTRGF